MKELILAYQGEMTLKGLNRGKFEARLAKTIRWRLEPLGKFKVYQAQSTVFIEPKEDGVGFEIYLLAEYRQTLSEVLAETPMTQSGAVNLGLDLCSALCSLREAGLIHRNVKPSNVYLSSSGHYLLGDLGIAKIDELKYCSMPENMLSSFSAPELFSLLGTIEPTTDIYSVGMILYRIYNGRRKHSTLPMKF